MPQVRPHQEINWLKNGSGWKLCPWRGEEEEKRGKSESSVLKPTKWSVCELSDIIIHMAPIVFPWCWQSRLFAFRFVHIHLLYLPKWLYASTRWLSLKISSVRSVRFWINIQKDQERKHRSLPSFLSSKLTGQYWVIWCFIFLIFFGHEHLLAVKSVLCHSYTPTTTEDNQCQSSCDPPRGHEPILKPFCFRTQTDLANNNWKAKLGDISLDKKEVVFF